MNSIRRYKALKPHLYREAGVWYCTLGNWTASALTLMWAYERRINLEPNTKAKAQRHD